MLTSSLETQRAGERRAHAAAARVLARELEDAPVRLASALARAPARGCRRRCPRRRRRRRSARRPRPPARRPSRRRRRRPASARSRSPRSRAAGGRCRCAPLPRRSSARHRPLGSLRSLTARSRNSVSPIRIRSSARSGSCAVDAAAVQVGAVGRVHVLEVDEPVAIEDAGVPARGEVVVDPHLAAGRPADRDARSDHERRRPRADRRRPARRSAAPTTRGRVEAVRAPTVVGVPAAPDWHRAAAGPCSALRATHSRNR